MSFSGHQQEVISWFCVSSCSVVTCPWSRKTWSVGVRNLQSLDLWRQQQGVEARAKASDNVNLLLPPFSLVGFRFDDYSSIAEVKRHWKHFLGPGSLASLLLKRISWFCHLFKVRTDPFFFSPVQNNTWTLIASLEQNPRRSSRTITFWLHPVKLKKLAS